MYVCVLCTQSEVSRADTLYAAETCTHTHSLKASKHKRSQHYACQQWLRLAAQQAQAVLLTYTSGGVLHKASTSVCVHCNTDDQRAPATLTTPTSTQQGRCRRDFRRAPPRRKLAVMHV